MLHTTNLHRHPASPCPAVTALQVSCVLADGGVRLRFQVEGEVNALRIPAPASQADAMFADNLWQHTCFEAFIGTAQSVAYREFNFSPSGQWAAYAFTDYRQRDTTWQPAQAPHIMFGSTADGLVLEAHIPAALLPVITTTTTPATPAILHIGLTAVIEANDGTLSYWALAHTGDRPDFHQRASFTLQVAYDSGLHTRSSSRQLHTDQP